MARLHRVGGISIIAIAVYLLAFFSILQIPLLEKGTAELLLPVLPWWLLVSFGAYSLFSIGWGLLTFRECPEAYDELMQEISQAKNELRAKGVSVD